MATSAAPPAAASLEEALRRTKVRVRPGRFALLSLPRARLVAALDALARLEPRGFAQAIVEPDGISLLLPEASLARALKAAGIGRVERGFRLLTLTCPVEWTVVGFLARVSRALASAGVPIGVVCAYDVDHLFVPESKLGAARRALARALRAAARGRP